MTQIKSIISICDFDMIRTISFLIICLNLAVTAKGGNVGKCLYCKGDNDTEVRKQNNCTHLCPDHSCVIIFQSIAIDATEVHKCPSAIKHNSSEYTAQILTTADIHHMNFKRCKIDMDEEGYHCGKFKKNMNFDITQSLCHKYIFLETFNFRA